MPSSSKKCKEEEEEEEEEGNEGNQDGAKPQPPNSAPKSVPPAQSPHHLLIVLESVFLGITGSVTAVVGVAAVTALGIRHVEV